MVRKGLSKEKIIEAAAKLIEEKGYKFFSVRELAARLDIKAATLYYYVTNIDELSREVGLKAIAEMKDMQEEAICGKERGRALLDLAIAYRNFARRRPYLYQVVMSLPDMEKSQLVDNAGDIIQPLMRVLTMYKVSAEDRMHYQRILRSVMHGFAALESAGYFAHFPVDTEASYHLAIADIISALEMREKRLP